MTWEKFKQFFIRLYEKSFDEDIFSSAAQVAFYFLFALFPLLLFVLTLFGFILGKADDMRHELFTYLRQIMPASAYDLVDKTLTEVVKGSSSGKLTIGILITIWSASAGIDSLRVALNAVYKLKEHRSWWKRKLMSLFLIFAIGISIFIALGIIFYGSYFLTLILQTIKLPIPSPFFLAVLSFVVVLLLLLLTFELLYNLIPDHDPFAWKWITPGAFVSIVLWLLLSKGLGIYLQYFDTYAKTYGSLGAIIILMLWLYLTALVILIGGTMNAILDEFSAGKFEKSPDESEPAEKITDKTNEQKAENSDESKDGKEKEIKPPVIPIAVSVTARQTAVKETVQAASKPLPAINNIAEELNFPDTNKINRIAKNSYFNLIIGSAFGLLVGLIFTKKNR